MDADEIGTLLAVGRPATSLGDLREIGMLAGVPILAAPSDRQIPSLISAFTRRAIVLGLSDKPEEIWREVLESVAAVCDGQVVDLAVSTLPFPDGSMTIALLHAAELAAISSD